MLSVYYGTMIQLEVWKPFAQQQDAYYYQDPDWIDTVEGTGALSVGGKIASALDMDANPYRRYCRDHSLPLGSRIEPVEPNSLKYRTTLALTYAILPFRHLLGIFEAIIRLVGSMILTALTTTGTLLRLNRLFPNQVKEYYNHFQEKMYSPKTNLYEIIKNISMFSVYCFAAPMSFYNNLDRENSNGFYKDSAKQIREMTGEDLPLWK